MNHKIGFIGLGLIGGSIARAVRQYFPDYEIVAFDKNKETLALATQESVIDVAATTIDDNFRNCRYLFLCAPVSYNTAYLRQIREYLHDDCILTDVGSVKTNIHKEVEALGIERYFIGGHPMAGRERGGFTASSEDLYVGASMILTPDHRTDMLLLETLKAYFLDIGFAGLTFSDPEEHDRIIAFTSQLAHIASSAYVKSPEAQRRRGFSAGSFQDMTRVARLDEAMWTELFMADRDYLTKELDILIANLQAYADALKSGDAERVRALLKEGRELKATAGGN